ncbi:hypothetical protein C8F01DRAFT_1348770 [Mycena amicta]|nr:hypothetical protein C8F01DRAFT_1348770 [Mycena amicta]
MSPTASQPTSIPTQLKSSALEDSLARFMDTLSAAESAWLLSGAGTSWQTVIAELEALNQKHLESSKLRKLLTRVRRFADALNPFLKAVEPVLSSTGPAVGAIWGALKLVIELTHTFTEHFVLISDTLETIAIELPIFQDYAVYLYPKSEAVQKAITVVLEDIISVFLTIHSAFVDTKGQKRSPIFVSLKAFDNQMNTITAQLEKHRLHVEKQVQHAERLAAKKDREVQEYLAAKFAEEEQRALEMVFYGKVERFQTLLDAPNCWEKHQSSLCAYEQPTCWILNHESYKLWDSKNCGLLWCHAKPGIGKTVLCSMIIKTLQEKYRPEPKVPVVFFYGEYNNHTKRHVNNLLAAILDQLMYNPDILNLVKETWMRKTPNLTHLSQENLQSLIVELLQMTKHSYILIDALDEFQHPAEVAAVLIKLAAYSSVFVTSRSGIEEISKLFGSYLQLCITAEDVHADISYFVSQSLESH